MAAIKYAIVVVIGLKSFCQNIPTIIIGHMYKYEYRMYRTDKQGKTLVEEILEMDAQRKYSVFIRFIRSIFCGSCSGFSQWNCLQILLAGELKGQ
jgi:hypothetical protein